MIIADTDVYTLKSLINKMGIKVTNHCIGRIMQRLGGVPLEKFVFDLGYAYGCYQKKTRKAIRKTKFRVNREGACVRKEYFVHVNGIIFVFCKDNLVSVYVKG